MGTERVGVGRVASPDTNVGFVNDLAAVTNTVSPAKVGAVSGGPGGGVSVYVVTVGFTTILKFVGRFSSVPVISTAIPGIKVAGIEGIRTIIKFGR